MSIKQNIKGRILIVVALAMTVALLAAGTIHSETRALTDSTNTTSEKSMAVGESVTPTIPGPTNDFFLVGL